jgi:hypothetical protein
MEFRIVCLPGRYLKKTTGCKTIILPLVLYACTAQLLKLREKDKLRAFANGAEENIST